MENMFRGNQTVGEIVTFMPKAGEVFKRYKIDFCCGGNRRFSDAIKEQNLDEAEVLKMLGEAYEKSKKGTEKDKDYKKMSRTELIDYIVDTHHVYVKEVLPEIGEMLVKLMEVHGLNHPVLFRVHKLFSTLRTELEQHLIKEEELLFPIIKQYDNNPNDQIYIELNRVMKETEDEHEGAGNILKELRKITDDYRVPEDGCKTYHKAFKTLEELEADLFQHIHLENNILFKYFAN